MRCESKSACRIVVVVIIFVNFLSNVDGLYQVNTVLNAGYVNRYTATVHTACSFHVNRSCDTMHGYDEQSEIN